MFLLTALLTGVGCSGDSSPATGGTGGTGGSTATGGSGGTGAGGAGGGGDIDSSVDCSVRTDVDLYSANMTRKGVNGLMSFLLIQSDPGPPILGSNVWKLKVTDASGMPVIKNIVVEPFMPEHGHTSPKTVKVTYDTATGIANLDPVYLSMGGKWQVTIRVVDPNDSTLDIDRVVFNFCVA